LIRIRSRKEGFRRCGVVHSTAWSEYPAGRFSADELNILRNEPMLQIEEAEGSESPALRDFARIFQPRKSKPARTLSCPDKRAFEATAGSEFPAFDASRSLETEES